MVLHISDRVIYAVHNWMKYHNIKFSNIKDKRCRQTRTTMNMKIILSHECSMSVRNKNPKSTHGQDHGHAQESSYTTQVINGRTNCENASRSL